MKTRKHRDPEWLRHEYEEKHRTLQDIGDECGVSRQAVHDAAMSFGIEYVPPSKRIDIDWLREQRETKKRTIEDIAEEKSVSRRLISQLCAESGIRRPKRTKEERAAWVRAYQNNKYATDPVYKEMKRRSVSNWRKTHRDRHLEYQREWRRKKSEQRRSGRS